jgi:hypothetical protein
VTARLTDLDQRLIDRARELAAVPADGNCAYAGIDDVEMARAEALGRAKHLLGELAAIAERLGSDEGQAAQPGEDSRRLGKIRELLSHFDWEHHDRQLALEAIERIADGETDGR